MVEPNWQFWSVEKTLSFINWKLLLLLLPHFLVKCEHDLGEDSIFCCKLRPFTGRRKLEGNQGEAFIQQFVLSSFFKSMYGKKSLNYELSHKDMKRGTLQKRERRKASFVLQLVNCSTIFYSFTKGQLVMNGNLQKERIATSSKKGNHV